MELGVNIRLHKTVCGFYYSDVYLSAAAAQSYQEQLHMPAVWLGITVGMYCVYTRIRQLQSHNTARGFQCADIHVA